VTRLTEPDKGRCVTNPRILSRGECETPKGSGIWDEPCTQDADCPFFQANRTYPNYRGGCNQAGYCEMPIGVKRLGYRKFDAKDTQASLPYCHGCSDNNDPRACCIQQGDTPDYAFPMDVFHRRQDTKKA
jgi:hypothetical protein